MRKKIFSTGIALALSASICMAPLTAEAAITPGNTYKDTGKHWSLQVVEKASALDLIKGYPGNLFKPESPVSRLEAVAIIIRAMGLEEEAQKLDVAKSGIKLPGGMTWGQGHLVLAAQKGLLSRNYVPSLKYRDAITRQEVATLVAVALINDKKIKNGDPSRLTFADTAKTLDLYKPYVAAVTENNIMQGIGENKFGPELIMKRGQMAALMAKLAQDGWFSYGSDRLLTGTVVSLNTTSGLLTLKKSDGSLIYKVLNSSPALFKEGNAASLDQVRPGTPVIVALNQPGMIQYMEVPKEPPADSIIPDIVISGRVDYSPASGNSYLKISGSNMHYSLSDKVLVKDDLGIKDMSAVTNGKYVTLKIKSDKVYHIQILSTVATEGRIYSVGSNSLFIDKNGGGTATFTLKPGETMVSSGSRSLAISDLKAGGQVKVVSSGDQALEVIVTEMMIRGTVRNVDAPYRSIAVLDDYDNRLVYEVDRYAVITAGGRNITLDSIREGDKVKITVGGDSKIIKMEVEQSVQYFEGKVIALRLGSSPRITIETNDSVARSYYFTNNTRVTRNGNNLDPEDVMIGAGVRIVLDEDNDYVKEIQISNDSDITVEGQVIRVEQDNRRITIEQSSGAQFRLRVDSDSILRDQVDSGNYLDELGDIRAGWSVRLTLEDEEVTYIRVTDK